MARAVLRRTRRTPSNIAQRKRALSSLLEPYGVSVSGIDYLVDKRANTVEYFSARLGKLSAANVPLKGIVFKLSLTKPKFDALIKRFTKRQGLTDRQFTLKKFLVSKRGVSEETALSLARGKGRDFGLGEMKQKIAFFKSMKLDPAIYGLEKIPVSMYEKLLHKPLSAIKTGGKINRDLLWKLADAHATKRLGALLPGWRRWKTLQPVKTIVSANGSVRKVKRPFRPATILRKVEEAIANGVKPSAQILGAHSAGTISIGRANTRGSFRMPELMARVRRGSRHMDSAQRAGLRLSIVGEIISRPQFSVNRAWLRKHITEKHSLPARAFSNIIRELSSLGVIQQKKGYTVLSKRFRGHS